MSKPYSFNIRKINEAKRGLVKSLINEDKREIRRWAKLLKANTELLIDLLTEQINDEGKLPQGELFTEGVFGKSEIKERAKRITKEEDRCDYNETVRFIGIASPEEYKKFVEGNFSSISGLPHSDSTNSDSGSSEKTKGSNTY